MHRSSKILLACLFLIFAGCTGVPDGIAPVSAFNAERYLGKWYEIARLDHSFEEGLKQVTGEYSWRNDGGISVVNRGYLPVNDWWEQATGKAYFKSSPDIGHLKVSFFGPFYSSYVIFELRNDYEYAFVAGHNHKYLWLLSRTPTITGAVNRRFVDKANILNIKTEELILGRSPIGMRTRSTKTVNHPRLHTITAPK